jgi:hypothetical protein
MSEYLSVTLAPWATSRIVRDYGKPGGRGVTQAMLMLSLVDFPDTEFHSDRGYLTRREGAAQGITHFEVRKPNGDILKVIPTNP